MYIVIKYTTSAYIYYVARDHCVHELLIDEENIVPENFVLTSVCKKGSTLTTNWFYVDDRLEGVSINAEQRHRGRHPEETTTHILYWVQNFPRTFA